MLFDSIFYRIHILRNRNKDANPSLAGGIHPRSPDGSGPADVGGLMTSSLVTSRGATFRRNETAPGPASWSRDRHSWLRDRRLGTIAIDFRSH